MVARQLVRALRGHRSQVQLARRLGFRTNPVAEWEAGRRRPRVAVVLRIAELNGVDVGAAFRAFAPAGADAASEGLGAWLDRLRGRTSVAEVARRSGASRHQVTRLLTGAAEPRLPMFLQLVEAITGRVVDLVAALTDIAAVPALAPLHARLQAARALATAQPWSAAVVAALDVPGLATVEGAAARIGQALELPPDVVDTILDTLAAVGAVRERRGRWIVDGGLTIDARAGLTDVKLHWNKVAAKRIAAPRPGDLLAFNVLSISEADLERLRVLQRAYFREIRSLVAASQPAEHVVLLQMHLLPLTRRD
ncbi:MAG: helix-turn-helix domain-containing protein [Myxococcota bacterium]